MGIKDYLNTVNEESESMMKRRRKFLELNLKDSLNSLGYADKIYDNISLDEAIKLQAHIEKFLKKMK